MGKSSKGMLLLSMLLSFHGCWGYAYSGFVQEKEISKRPHKRQVVVAFADYHLKSHPANTNQRIHIESQLKRCAALKGKFIVEDLSSINNDGKMVCCNFGINCSQGILGQLANKARALGAAVDNVEYRYCRVATIGPLLSNIQASPFSFKSTSSITMASLYKEVIDELEKIKKYDDGKFLNDVYKRTIAKVQAALSKLGFNKAMTVANFCKTLQHKQYRQELEKLCIFDSALVDMNIMHAIAVSPDVPLIFIIAGGSHIEQVGSLLKRMGYKSVVKKSVKALPVVKKILDSGSSSLSSDFHPEPIDITAFDIFIQ
jgi:hypothetical protein